MVDYDQAVAIIQDVNADPVLLAKVAYENPEFGANVAAHPKAYPGLLRWIAQFGDERARQTAAQLGYQAADGPVVDRVESVTVAEAQPVSFEPQQSVAAEPASDVDMLHDHFAANSEPQVQQSYEQPSYEQPQQSYEQAQPAYEQPVTNQYGFTAQLAATTTDPAVMQQIAQYAPELRATLATNPYLYRELLDWLYQLNDPAILQALQSRQ